MAENKEVSDRQRQLMREAILAHRQKMETDPVHKTQFERELEKFKEELHFFREHPNSD